MKKTPLTEIGDALHNPQSPYFAFVNNVVVIVVAVSILALILETVDSLKAYSALFETVELLALGFFTLEYALRIATAPNKPAYLFSFFGCIDFLAVVPGFLPMLGASSLASVRSLRVVQFLRTLRFAKVIRHQLAPGREHRHGSLHFLTMQVYFSVLFSSIVILGGLLYVIEGNQPGFANMPLAMLYISEIILGGITLKRAPVTVPGELITILTRFIGLVLFGVLIAIVGDAVKRFIFGTSKVTEFDQDKE